MPTSKEQRIIGALTPRTTDLSSRQLKSHPAWTQRVKDEAMFSARTTYDRYVEMLKQKVQAVASRDITPQKAQEQLQQALENIGYTPQKGFPGNKTVPPALPRSMTDLSSSRRIQLILDTNIKKARSLGQMAAGEDPVFLASNPAWRLTRTGARKKPRGDWKERWAKAGASVAWKGAAKRQMVALKDSPIWKALGDGEGGYDDTVGSPFPPFAFGSGLAWVNVGRREWERICKDEGIQVEQPKAPAPSSASVVPQTDEEKKTEPPKRDLPEYAQSPEFQKRLRKALADYKESRRSRSSPDREVSTEDPVAPTSRTYEFDGNSENLNKVYLSLRNIEKRLNFLKNIQSRYYEKVLKEIRELAGDSGSDLGNELVVKAESAVSELKKSVSRMTKDRDVVRGYLDKMRGYRAYNPKLFGMYAESAVRKSRQADSDYRSEMNRNVGELLERARQQWQT